MTDIENGETEHDEALTPSCYFEQASLEELRRYVCLDMARLGGALPDRLVKLARDMERYLTGRALRSAEEGE